MTAPSQTPEAAGLEVVAWLGRVGPEEDDTFVTQDPSPHPRRPEIEYQPLVTAASAQAAMGEAEETIESLKRLVDQHYDRATAAEARADRLAKALEPFAAAADFWDAIYDDSEVMKMPAAFVDAWRSKHGKRKPVPQFINGDLRSARAVLQQETHP